MEDKSKNSKVLVIVLIAVIAILAAVGITMGVLLMNPEIFAAYFLKVAGRREE